MLRTNPLAHFLNQSRVQSPHIQSLLLLAPNGFLHSSSSTQPSSQLRRQATLASQLWALYAPLCADTTLSSALISHNSDSAPERSDLKSVTLQLSEGVMVIRQLACELLLVVLGPPPPERDALDSDITASVPRGIASSPYNGSTANSRVGSLTTGPQYGLAARAEIDRSDAGSVRTNTSMSTGTGMGGVGTVKALRKVSEEVCGWLDRELVGFVLPDDGK